MAGAPANPQVVTQNPITLAVDVAQEFFINEHWAVRIDLRNHIYQESVYKAEARQLQLPVRRTGELIEGLITFLQTLLPPDSDDAVPGNNLGGS